MRLSSYTRSDRARRGRMASGRVPRVLRFCFVFFGLFAVAGFFWGGDMLAYAQEGSYLLLGLTVLISAIFGCGVNSKGSQDADADLSDNTPFYRDFRFGNPYDNHPKSPRYGTRE